MICSTDNEDLWAGPWISHVRSPATSSAYLDRLDGLRHCRRPQLAKTTPIPIPTPMAPYPTAENQTRAVNGDAADADRGGRSLEVRADEATARVSVHDDTKVRKTAGGEDGEEGGYNTRNTGGGRAGVYVMVARG